MRASTLFALTVAVLMGLGVAVAARVAGIFKTSEPPARAEVKVLVAKKNLFAGDVIDGSGTLVRPMTPDEFQEYQARKDDYLPPVPSAAELRIAKEDILADQPILKSKLQGLAKPEALHTRLLSSMRAVSVSLDKDKAAGGLIQTGEWVDVLLTSEITDPSGNKSTRTAAIAPAVRVVAKRNTLWPVFAPLPKGEPIQFTLEVNPYRAALIEFGKTKGDLTLVPLPGSEQKKLEGERTALLERGGDVRPVVFVAQIDGVDAAEEEGRVDAYARGEAAVGEGDLMRIFGVTTQAPPETQVTIQQLGGVNHYAPASFTSAGQRVLPASNSSNGSRATMSATSGTGGFAFAAPDCKTCKKFSR